MKSKSLRHVVLGMVLTIASTSSFAQSSFGVEESTIEGVHRAIQSGATTCKAIVQSYVDRARAYNGICTRLVTKDGAPVKVGPGPVRAGAPLKFPKETVAVSSILPNFSEYQGLPIEYGRMEPTQSDPSVQQQYGMLVGMSNAGQVNALSTLNLRGERSVSCKAKCDLHPSKGALPKSCPAACESFRQQPDALERAAELDAQYGRNPDLEKLPMYCIAFSFKDVFDAKDMRSTGGADVSYAMDAAPEDSTIVARLREKGAIIYAKANLSEYNGGGGNPGGSKATTEVYGAGSRSAWPGVSCRRVELRLRFLRGCEPGELLDLRGDRRFLSSAGLEKWRGGLHGHQGNDAVRRFHRRRSVRRSRRHPLSQRQRLGSSARRTEKSEARQFLRFARHLYGTAQGIGAQGVVRLVRDRRGRAQAPGGQAHRYRARIHGQTFGQRRGHERSRQRGDCMRTILRSRT
jgi:hypothetical protein